MIQPAKKRAMEQLALLNLSDLNEYQPRYPCPGYGGGVCVKFIHTQYRTEHFAIGQHTDGIVACSYEPKTIRTWYGKSKPNPRWEKKYE